MLLYSFLKTLTGQEVVLELKNDLKIRGTLTAIDQYHNVRLDAVEVENNDRYPHLNAVSSLFVRGPTIRYAHLPKDAVDTDLLQDATRREAARSIAL